jgi:prefoldin subunit 5
MWKLSSAAQEKFMSALDKRDEEFEKRNDKVCANLEKLAETISRLQNSRKGD